MVEIPPIKLELVNIDLSRKLESNISFFEPSLDPLNQKDSLKEIEVKNAIELLLLESIHELDHHDFVDPSKYCNVTMKDTYNKYTNENDQEKISNVGDPVVLQVRNEH